MKDSNHVVKADHCYVNSLVLAQLAFDDCLWYNTVLSKLFKGEGATAVTSLFEGVVREWRNNLDSRFPPKWRTVGLQNGRDYSESIRNLLRASVLGQQK